MTRQKRKRIFLGCEGESERSYGALIQSFAEEENLNIHIERCVLSGGDPKKLVYKTINVLKNKKPKLNNDYIAKFVLMDTDRFESNTEFEITELAENHNITLLKQKICFESVLIRHFEPHLDDKPSSSSDALQKLKKIWPEYEKGLSADELNKRIAFKNIKYAAKSKYNNGLKILLKSCGFKI